MIDSIPFEKGVPLMEQTRALPAQLDRLALKGAEVVFDKIEVQGSPSFPDAIIGSRVSGGGTYVSFESITPEHSVMHMHAPGVSSKKVAESGQGFLYGLPADMTAAEAARLSAGLKFEDSK